MPDTSLEIAIVGGGINGLCIAWVLAEQAHQVTLFERDQLMSQTSSASTKLLHGGLRYLETGQIRLVREALRERAWWLAQVPSLTQPLALYLPVYAASARAAWRIRTGLWLYDRLAGKTNIAPHARLDRAGFIAQAPELRPAGLRGGFRFFDGQMDDLALGLWVADQARQAGARLLEGAAVSRVSTSGMVTFNGETRHFDRVINVAGPWAEALLQQSGLRSRCRLELIRGSHILFDEPLDHGYCLQAPQDSRVFFVIPYQGRTLVGTTEERHNAQDWPPACHESEAHYLLTAYNAHFRRAKSVADIAASFAGVRPLVRSAAHPSKLSRDYTLERHDRLITVFGGKWTTTRALAHSVARWIL
ncbi:glycerol-3-phosphate dehydrogenase/oxidase [Thiohalocapsa sp. ML1]|jgi:glycerol-3-phosphate dehydrogenase|uniref:glycerol-3-phosphate dehydrogenase/oxidase n=1 Tax=Thiohalocapsa sp. ML1 TaxID=1431688 RepID=UPI000731F845|nr:glycerol-3-phosphate dehydrogenase/oxidase [Thiohalocapsa sp. ML1]